MATYEGFSLDFLFVSVIVGFLITLLISFVSCLPIMSPLQYPMTGCNAAHPHCE